MKLIGLSCEQSSSLALAERETPGFRAGSRNKVSLPVGDTLKLGFTENMFSR